MCYILQNLHQYIFVTLNTVIPIDEALQVQKELQQVIQGANNTWFWHGFHEDAFMIGVDVAERLSGYRTRRPWTQKLALSMTDNRRTYELLQLSSNRLLGYFTGGSFGRTKIGERPEQNEL